MKTPAVIQEAMDEVSELQIAPLIDCVFQLLIYFMVVASLQRTEADLGIQLPGSMVVSKPGQFPEEQVVEVGADAKVRLNDKVYDAHGRNEMPELTATLVRYRLASQAARSKAIVTIMADDKSRHQRVIDVLNACANAGIKDVTFIK
jgi:biopolymer transport protein ExbD